MTLPLRQRHRRMFAVLGVLLPLAFVAGIAAHKPVPAQGSLANQFFSSRETFTTTQWERGDLFTNAPIQVRLLRERAGHGQFALQLSSAHDFVKPDLLVYWSSGAGTIAETIPDNAVLLGVFNSNLPLPFPAETTATNGVLVLYSLADHETVALSKSISLK